VSKKNPLVNDWFIPNLIIINSKAEVEYFKLIQIKYSQLKRAQIIGALCVGMMFSSMLLIKILEIVMQNSGVHF
jgi:hypothetical protein